MQKRKGQLPPLDPLVAFEAAARHSSFTMAAKELNLSQAAVSQQIRNLEQSLGVPLFTRAHRAVQLSPQGREFQHTVSTILRQLASVTADLKAPAAKARLTIAADQSVASMWLMPRLPRFQQLFPDVVVRLVASDDDRECLADDIQISIIYGTGNWAGFHAEKFIEEEVFPVCSPSYFDNRKPLTSPTCLTNETLLELEDNHWDWMNWRTWLSGNNVDLPTEHRGLQINNYPLLIQAARNGQGIALGWRYLIDDDLNSGSLIKPIDTSLRTASGYYLVWSDQRELSAMAAAFREWAGDELKKQSVAQLPA